MLLKISTTHHPATDLSLLLMKNPANVHSFELNFGSAHVFFPEASEDNCSACLLLDVDAVGLVRGGAANNGIEQYVNDRPYVCSSFMSVAIAKCFGTALSGNCKYNETLPEQPLPLVASLSAVGCRGGEEVLRSLFEPLGYEFTDCRHLPLDERFPEWGESRYFSFEIRGTVRLQDLLSHLYVLIPVLDDEKHYFVAQAEVDKLLRHGEGWLATHPSKNLISRRYLAHKQSLSRMALSRLVDEDDTVIEETENRQNKLEEEVEKPLSLNEQRIEAVVNALRKHDVRSVIDLGCGEGRYVKKLMEQKFEKVAGMDVSPRELEKASYRLRLDKMPERMRERVALFQGSLIYRDERVRDYEAAICVEVIEHMDLSRLPAFEYALFKFARPGLIIVTTPNIEYNKKFETLPEGKLRHGDHRFEWTRAEFQSWANNIAEAAEYSVTYANIGPVDEELGAPTQMAVFVRPDFAAPAPLSVGETN